MLQPTVQPATDHRLLRVPNANDITIMLGISLGVVGMVLLFRVTHLTARLVCGNQNQGHS